MLCIARVPGAVPAIINTVPRAWVENSARRRSASGIYLGRDGFYSSVPDGCRSIGYRHASGSKKFYFL
jgi:hypothetical protein